MIIIKMLVMVFFANFAGIQENNQELQILDILRIGLHLHLSSRRNLDGETRIVLIMSHLLVFPTFTTVLLRFIVFQTISGQSLATFHSLSANLLSE